MSPLQAAAVENRLTAVRRKVVSIAYANRSSRPFRYQRTSERRAHALNALKRVLAAIDTELAKVRTA